MNTFRRTFVMATPTTSCLEGSPEDGALLVFVHGWPGLASAPKTTADIRARLHTLVAQIPRMASCREFSLAALQ